MRKLVLLSVEGIAVHLGVSTETKKGSALGMQSSCVALVFVQAGLPVLATLVSLNDPTLEAMTVDPT